jgi:hypothetical protein
MTGARATCPISEPWIWIPACAVTAMVTATSMEIHVLCGQTRTWLKRNLNKTQHGGSRRMPCLYRSCPARVRSRISDGSNSAAAPRTCNKNLDCWIFLISIQSLRNGNEPDSMLFQTPDVIQAILQGSPKPVQFPDQEAIEFSLLPRPGHKAVKAWPGWNRVFSRTRARGPRQNLEIVAQRGSGGKGVWIEL